MSRVGQNRIYTPYMTVYLVITLPEIPYMHRICMVLANPTHVFCSALEQGWALYCERVQYILVLHTLSTALTRSRTNNNHVQQIFSPNNEKGQVWSAVTATPIEDKPVIELFITSKNEPLWFLFSSSGILWHAPCTPPFPFDLLVSTISIFSITLACATHSCFPFQYSPASHIRWSQMTNWKWFPKPFSNRFTRSGWWQMGPARSRSGEEGRVGGTERQHMNPTMIGKT